MKTALSTTITSWFVRLVCFAVLIAATSCGGESRTRSNVAPIVAGLAHPNLAPTTVAARVRGRVLLGELGCVACHDGGSSVAREHARPGPNLATVGTRLEPEYLRRFLADPHAIEPGTVMPDPWGSMGADERAAAVEAVAAYLQSFSDGVRVEARGDEPGATDEARARGRDLYRSIGCAACHNPRNAEGRAMSLQGSVALPDLRAKYSARALREFLLEPHQARPAARMPDFGLSPQEAFDLAAFLRGSGEDSESTARAPSRDEAQVDSGRRIFAARGCANCHDLPDPLRPATARAKPLRDVNRANGCMSGGDGDWPYYALSEAQREELNTALALLDESLDGESRIQQHVLARNCIACHERGEIGGVAEDRNRYFKTDDPSIGYEGRIPPPLTGVGAKLQSEWLHTTIAHGQAERPYVTTRMPGFGASAAATLAPLFETADSLPELESSLAIQPLPKKRKEANVVLDLGRELVGSKGMNCISCHSFAGQDSEAMGALDLVNTTGKRLRPEWFAHYLRDPFRFKPNTLMPQFYPDGVSIRPTIADGDTGRQISAMWHYLAKGRNVRKPRGIRRKPIPIEVGQEAVLLRRSVQNTGKRGISVGYPGGVNITFDAERLGMNQVWWGPFLDAAPVWTGQGSGQARILGKERAKLAVGPAFVELDERDATWPDKTRRDLGHRWLGYDLDEVQRPTFRYTSGGVTISDTPRELQGGATSRVTLQRTIRFESERDVTLQFRIATGKALRSVDGDIWQVGRELRVRVKAARLVGSGDARELRVEVPVSAKGGAEVVVEYSWIASPK